ncbi:MAG: hypothetical protein AB7U62_03060 [Pseudolabrys sp.]
MRSSQRAFDLVVAEEVTSQAVYSKKYRRPEWPGAASGVTIGVGYDLGQTSRATIQADWGGRVSAPMLEAMLSASGVTGTAAKPLAAKLRSKIDIPWETAIAVHEECVFPRWEAKLARALPNTDRLPADCYGALVSLAFNRGTSFSTAGERYREMRAIKAHMADEDFASIPAELRSMKRLWSKAKLPGLHARRDREAKLFELGLKSMAAAPVAFMDQDGGRPPRTDDIAAVDEGGDETSSLDLSAKRKASPVEEAVQRALDQMGYPPGIIGDVPGGMTAGAIAAFKTDRHLDGEPVIDQALLDEIEAAKAEGFRRPIGVERANATEKTIAPKVAAVRENGFSRLWAKILAIPSAGLAAVSGAWEKLPDAKDYVAPAKDFFTDMPGWVWFTLAAIVGLLIWRSTRRTGEAVVKDFQEGRRL